MNEIWKTCVECEAYAISDLGNVRRSIAYPYNGFIPFKNLVQVYDKGHYRKVCMRYNRKQLFKMVHTLVASAFIGKRPKGYEINHKDGNKSNNSISNLEYVTHRQNIDHAMSLGLTLKAEKATNVRFTTKDILNMRSLFPILSQGKIAKLYGTNQAHVSRIIRRVAWASI